MPPLSKPFAPRWANDMVSLYCGHVIDVLGQMPAGKVQCCVTSPPYWGLRDYKTGSWEGGDKPCNHMRGQEVVRIYSSTLAGTTTTQNHSQELDLLNDGKTCRRCGAVRIDQQIGAESLHDCLAWARADGPGWDVCERCFVCSMVTVFREVRRVLRNDGVLFLNLGDTYSGGNKGAGGALRPHDKQATNVGTWREKDIPSRNGSIDLSSGNLCGMPWRTALALQRDGWTLRSDVPFVKRSAMPESANTRPNRALEYVFMLTKEMRYYFDMETIRKESTKSVDAVYGPKVDRTVGNRNGLGESTLGPGRGDAGRNFRNADPWFESIDKPHGLCGVDDELVGLDVTSEPYPGRHFAVFPSGLIRPLIKAATSERGCCVDCGKAWVRVVNRVGGDNEANGRPKKTAGMDSRMSTLSLSGQNEWPERGSKFTTVGWRPDCCCRGELEGAGGAWTYHSDVPLDEHPVEPCLVLDPFVGSGTTAVVCQLLGRRCWGIDLSAEYIDEHAAKRVQACWEWVHDPATGDMVRRLRR